MRLVIILNSRYFADLIQAVTIGKFNEPGQNPQMVIDSKTKQAKTV